MCGVAAEGAEVNEQAAGTSITTLIPVIEGTAYRSSRGKYHQALSVLGISEVSASLAASEFSEFYRSLPSGQTIELELNLLNESVQTSLSIDVKPQDVQSLLLQLQHLQLQRDEADSRQSRNQRLILQRTYRAENQGNIEAASGVLQSKTAEEHLLSANATQEALTSTQNRLSSVQEDLRIAADIQQRMLLSRQRLQSIHAQLDCHACMVPCRDIGGDFYDVMRLDADHVAVIVGDVSGKGIFAAMMMATCITLLRAYCESFRSPSRIMRKINPRLIEGNESECLFTTLFLGMINCHRNSFTYCNAGHNPGLLRRRDGSILELNDVHGPAVGVMERVEYEETRLHFDIGDRLLLYTDGASEAFNPRGDLYGVERLHRYYERSSPRWESSQLLEHILTDLNNFSNGEIAHDDVTLVGIRRHQDEEIQEITTRISCEASPEGMTELMQQTESFCLQQQIQMDTIGRLQLVLDELVINVVRYGQGEEVTKPIIKLDLRLRQNLLVVELRDTGVPFNPFALAEPDTDLSIEERDLGGLGVFLVRGLTRNFSYTYDTPWNCVRLEIDCDSQDDQP